jgi:hypothetical protein
LLTTDGAGTPRSRLGEGIYEERRVEARAMDFEPAL